MELDYYHQEMNLQVASRVPKRLKIEDLWELGKFKKHPEILDLIASSQPTIQIPDFGVFW